VELPQPRAHPASDAGFDAAAGGTRTPITCDPSRTIPPAPDELGYKDVYRVPGNQVLRIMGRFEGAYGGHGEGRTG
jgi:spore coat protein A